MGHKAHPIGLRLGIHRKWKSNWFFESKNYTKFLQLNMYVENFIKGFLFFYKMKKTLVLQTQIVKLSNNILFVFVFYYRFRKKWKRSFYKKKKENLWKIYLEKYFLKKKIKFKYIFQNFKLYKNLYNYNLDSSLNLCLKKNNLLKFFKNLNIVLKSFYLKNIFLKKYFLKFNQKFFIKKYLLKINYLIKIYKSFNKLFIFNLQYKIKNILKVKLNLFLMLYLNILKNFIFFINNNFTKNNTLRISFYINIVLQKIKFFNKYLNLLKNFNFVWKKKILKKKIKFFNLLKKKTNVLYNYKYHFIYNKRSKNLVFLTFSNKNTLQKYFINKKKNKIKLIHPFTKIKKFLSKITNLKINLIFINGLSFTQFFYAVQETKTLKKSERRLNLWAIQRMMLNRYKYNAIFIKDFIHLASITILLKNPVPLVKFIAYQFKRLPKNRKQFKLLKFLNQSLYIFCKQRHEIVGFKFQITGRLNRRRRTHKWVFQKGILSLQTQKTRVEYAYSEGFTRRGLIGIHFWIFYDKIFSKILKKKLTQYLYYSKYKALLNKKNSQLQSFKNYQPQKHFKFFNKKNAKTKPKKISKK
jgi:ribosomal protein S3